MFRRTYDEIAELIRTTALDPAMARAIVRRAGLRAGSGDGDGSNLLEQFLSPNPPNALPHLPRRRVQNGLAWPYQPSLAPEGATYWDARASVGGVVNGDVSVGALESTQDYYNMLHFTNYSEHRGTPLGANLYDPGLTNQPQVGNPPVRTSRAWVGGQTTYDPFPFPSAPLYFWADLSEAITVVPFIDFFKTGSTTSPYRMAFVAEVANAVGSISLRLYGSLDSGGSWQAPFEVNGGNAGSAYAAKELNENYTPSSSEDGGMGRGLLRPEFQRDDVLFKFVVTTGNAANWIEFEDLGIRADDVNV